MKKNIFTIMLLISSTCINTFAEMKTDNNSTYTEDIPIPIKKPIRKSIHQLYIIGYLENGHTLLLLIRHYQTLKLKYIETVF